MAELIDWTDGGLEPASSAGTHNPLGGLERTYERLLDTLVMDDPMAAIARRQELEETLGDIRQAQGKPRRDGYRLT